MDTNGPGLLAGGASTLDLSELRVGLPAITPAGGMRLLEACAVCLEDRGHRSRCVLSVRGMVSTAHSIHWPEINDQMRRSLSDPSEATEEGACAIAILLILKHTEYTVVKRSWKGTGFDYYLGRKEDTAFQNAACLEVSGLLSGSDRQIERRFTDKCVQTRRYDWPGPAFVAIVEFGGPQAVLAES